VLAEVVSTRRRRSIAALLAASILSLQGCAALFNTNAMGLRDDKGVITSPADLINVGPDFVFHSTVVETRAWGGITFAGESKEPRITTTERGRPWWARVDRQEFLEKGWRARSLQVHEGPLPAELRDLGDPPAGECYSLRFWSLRTLMDMMTCRGKVLGNAPPRVTLREYRAWWAYPAMVVAYPLASAFDTATFPLQFIAYVYWNDENSRW